LPRASFAALLVCGVIAVAARTPAASNQGPPADTFPIETDVSCLAAAAPAVGAFRIDLTPQEKRAVSIYQHAIVITAHDHCFHPDDFRDAKKGGITARVIKPLTDGYYRRNASRFIIENPIDGWAARGREAIAILQQRSDTSNGTIRIIR